MKSKLCLLALISTSLWLAFNASATIVFTTLYPDGAYDSTTASAISGSSYRFGYSAWANQFFPSSSGTLTSIELALHYTPNISSPAEQVDVRLALDLNDPVYGHLPSTTNLAAGSVTVPNPFAPFSSDLVTFTPSGSPLLAAGTPYWVVVSPHFATTAADWNLNSRGAVGAFAASFDGATWGQNPSGVLNAFRVNAGPVPEPSSLSLVAIALGGLFSFRRARR